MEDIRICFVGDSFVNGTGDPEKLGWAGRLCKAAENEDREITFYNLGIRRNTSSDILGRWEAECEPRLIQGCDARFVLSFGVNDIVIENGSQRVDTKTSLANAKTILTKATARYKSLMIGPPPIDDDAANLRIRRLDRLLARLCRELSVPYLSVYERLEEDPTWRSEVASNAGAHPQAGGYTLLAEFIQDWEKWWF